ncbi:MAG TPA: Uma2 family endonuclease [Tepidiformaceae bacterium]|nr:Uma2 family endonuclease [Tepidiformaceae bacterium]
MAAPIATRMTLDEFLALPETKPYREFVRGEVFEKPMPNSDHSDLVFELNRLIGNYLVNHREGRGGTELRHADRAEDRVYLPDINVTQGRRASRRGSATPVEHPPDFAIEVLSPDDRASRILDKTDFYMRSGVRLLWLVDPDNESVTVYRPGQQPVMYHAPATIDARPVLSEFTLELGALFAVLEDDTGDDE